jgi:hypothetical protein
MFANKPSMLEFLRVLESHPGWSSLNDVLDMSVYGETQQFRTPCSTKAPDLANSQVVRNLLLPVDPVDGTVYWPVSTSHRPFLHVSLQTWLEHLVSTFWPGVQAQPLQSTFTLFTNLHTRVAAEATYLWLTGNILILSSGNAYYVHIFRSSTSSW